MVRKREKAEAMEKVEPLERPPEPAAPEPQPAADIPETPDYGPVLPVAVIAAKQREVVDNLHALESSEPYLVDALAFATQADISLQKQLEVTAPEPKPETKPAK